MTTNGNAKPIALSSFIEPVERGRPAFVDTRTPRAEHRNIVMMHLAGMSDAAIGRFFDCTEAHIANILSLPTVQTYMMRLQASYIDDLRPIAQRVNESIERHSERAAQVVVEIMDSMHEREEIRAQQLALASAQDILDRAGHKPALRVQSQNLHAHALTEATIDKMTAVLKELSAVQGDT